MAPSPPAPPRCGSDSHIEAALDLKAAMLDLDALAGAQSRDVLRQAGSLGVAVEPRRAACPPT